MFLLTIPRLYFFCGSFVFFLSCVIPLCASVAALWSPAGKGLTSWLLFKVFDCDWYPGSLRCGT